MITTEPIYRATITIGEVQELGETLGGQRRIIPITGGFFKGEEFSGEVLPGGADWQLVRMDGSAYVEARYTMRTKTGALIYVENKGYRHGPPDILARMAQGEAVDPKEYYFRTTPVLETAEPSLMWLNRTIFVASGERHPECVKLDVYAVR